MARLLILESERSAGNLQSQAPSFGGFLRERPDLSSSLMMEPCLIVRFSETTLKGGNRSLFEKRMVENIKAHLRPHGRFSVSREMARVTISNSSVNSGAKSGANGAEREGAEGDGAERESAEGNGTGGDLKLALEVLRQLPGVANVSLSHPVPSEIGALGQAVLTYLEGILGNRTLVAGERIPFRMEVSRKNKRYPLNSMEVASQLGRQALEKFPVLKVNLEHPQLVVQVEIIAEQALLSEAKVPGPGGLAVGTSGRGLCLISGGIDSPVAAHMMMTRGMRIIYLNFHSFPFIGERSKEKVHDLVRLLARNQPHSRLYVAPFAPVQVAIRDKCPEGLRTLLYRRTMNRVANRLAEREKAGAIVTGESLGQVASQTLPNIDAIAETAEVPVLQPLIGLAKTEIVHRAQAIGTYPISIQPYPDCCTLFQPRKPETRARSVDLQRAEARLDLEALVAECLDGLEMTDYGPEYYPAGWKA